MYLRLLLLATYAFLFIYEPIFWKRDIWEFLTLIAIGIMWLRWSHYRPLLHKMTSMPKFRLFLILLVLAVAYSIFTRLIHGYQFRAGVDKQYAKILLGGVPCALLIAFELKTISLGKLSAVYLIVSIAIMQGLLAVLSYTSPSVNAFLYRTCPENFDLIYAMDGKISEQRCFGLSSGLIFGAPIFQGYAAVLAFILFISGNRLMILASILCGFSGIINARTTLVILFVGVSLVFVYYFNRHGLGRAIAAKFGIVVAIVYLAKLWFMYIYETSNSELSMAAIWIKSGYDIINNTWNNSGESYDILFNEMWSVPDGLDWLFGSGKNIFGGTDSAVFSSDIGYVIDLHFGGVVFIGLLYGSIGFLLWPARQLNAEMRCVHWTALILIACANFKGNILLTNQFVSSVFVLAFFSWLCIPNYSKK